MIELSHVSAGYGKHGVLRDVSLSLEKGSLVSIIGVNGCGKSTLLKTIPAILPITDGSITLDGQSIDGLSRRDIARKVAWLPQGKTTADMTVEQMVLHGRFPYLDYPRRYTKQDRDIAYAAMERSGVAHRAQDPLRSLSGGMRQSACIAMALAQSTDYILLDEPATYLDMAHQLALMKTLRALAGEGKGIVAVMHDLAMAFTFSDRIILLHDGGILGDDVPAAIAGENAIRQLFGVILERLPGDQGYICRFSV